jgi:endonuclease YncB( thermonuclease family)
MATPFMFEKQNLLKIRMQGIDSPEWHLVTDAGVVGQLPWGRDAGEALNRMIPKGARVELEDFGHDKYGRTLGHLTHRGRNINIEQVRSGQAISYIICEAGRCDEDFLAEIHAGEVVDACHQAETQGLGVFNPRNRLREMPFEFRLKHQRRKADKFVGNLKTRTYFSPNQYKQVPVCDRIFFLSEKDAQALGFTLDSKN